MGNYLQILFTLYGNSSLDTEPDPTTYTHFERVNTDTNKTYYSDGVSWIELGVSVLDDLSDVDVTTVTPINNDVLTYNSTSGEWVPAAPPGASGGEANTANNVGTGEGDVFRDKTGTTINLKTIKAGTNVSISNDADEVTISATDTDTVTDALTDLTVDVQITTPTDNQILEYEAASSKWKNIDPPYAMPADLPTTIAELTGDVSISSPSNLQVLAYNTTTSKWENNTFNAETTGKATASGDGTTTQFTISHGLGVIPSYVFPICSSHAINFTYDTDINNITIDFVSAPSSGANNVVIYWKAIA